MEHPRTAFSSLANHLLAAYPVPEFMATAWLRDDDNDGPGCRELWFHIGAGNNPRTGKTPVAMSRRVAHHFLQAPGHYTIEGAVRWGQIAALGGSPALADACVATRLGEHFGNDAFWLSVIRWFIAHPDFDLAQVGPAVDFIRHVKFESTWTRDAGGIRFTPAPQPGFSMAGRTPASLLRQMEQWHARLHRGGVVPAPVATGWPTPRFHGLRLKMRRRGPSTMWTIERLDSTAALEREGQQMRHCVASYALRCAAGVCSIWSLEGGGRQLGPGASYRGGPRPRDRAVPRQAQRAAERGGGRDSAAVGGEGGPDARVALAPHLHDHPGFG